MLWATVLSTLVAAASANQQQLACSDIPAQSLHAHTCLDQPAQQLLYDRLFQTNLRGPRWTGNENQNTLVASVSESMQLAGLTVEHLDYSFYAWDARWWSLRLRLKNGTILGLPTTGYWPYSGNSGPQGRTAPVHDAGTYGLFDNQTANPATLNLNGLPQNGSILFFDNPSPTRNYSQPNYGLYGSSVPVKDIPELGNLTNPHWQSAKTLNFTALKEMGVMGVIASWVDTSDEDAALQFLPEVAPPNGTFNDVPSLWSRQPWSSTPPAT
ncbi:hypothetical protein FB45DRAFT_66483 [Roridomyces roridus]|uniref:Uncharacterized protein n=1 Tax=Roridomyces roridus TaxID=1738132 RepID=A0AAD7BMN1_9AGAR|nr:hypothetical protein FB45DRAFT_66483 [Roridomyces roridus]